METQGNLRIHGNGDIELERVYKYLKDFEDCYNSINTFTSILKQDSGSREDLVMRLSEFSVTQEIASQNYQKVNGRYIVGISDRLILKKVVLRSPGFWEFLGKLNPLEVIRQYLQDRHERKKDIDYRNSAEERRMHLENLMLENKVIIERLEFAEQMGYSKDDIAPLYSALVAMPLETLDKHQDQNVIEHAELVDNVQFASFSQSSGESDPEPA